MERTYTCLRCLKGLGVVRSSYPARRFPQVRQSRIFSTRGFSSSPTTSLKESANTNLSTPARQARLNRLAHTSPTPAQERDNFERHNQIPNDYGAFLAQSGTQLGPDNLFHPFSKSPVAAIRQRAAFINRHAYCPHPSHQQTRLPVSPDDPEARKGPEISTQPPAHVHFECPDCGIATYCSEEHWADDYEAHLEICDTLRQVNEDDHDLRSGRWFPEFDYPGPRIDEILVNLTNWDTFLYTRGFEAINEEQSMRQVTRLLTYPLTVGSVLHELSPYNIRAGGRLTPEGLKSLSGQYIYLGLFMTGLR